MGDELLRPEEASRLLKVTIATLINWDRDGKIRCTRTPGGHRRFFKSNIESMIGSSSIHREAWTSNEGGEKESNEDGGGSPPEGKKKICYCRGINEETLKILTDAMKKEYSDYEFIEDIGSNINSDKEGFKKLLGLAMNGNIDELVIFNKNQVCRFNFEIFEALITSSGGKITVLTEEITNDEVIDELFMVIDSFSESFPTLKKESTKKKILGEKEYHEATRRRSGEHSLDGIKKIIKGKRGRPRKQVAIHVN